MWRPRLIKSKRPSSPPVASAQIWNTLPLRAHIFYGCAPHDSKMSNLPPFGVTLLMYLLRSAAFAAFAWNIYFDLLLLAILLVQRMKSHRFDWFAVPAHFGRGCLKQIRFFFFISVLIGVPQKHARYLFLIYSHVGRGQCRKYVFRNWFSIPIFCCKPAFLSLFRHGCVDRHEGRNRRCIWKFWFISDKLLSKISGKKNLSEGSLTKLFLETEMQKFCSRNSSRIKHSFKVSQNIFVQYIASYLAS